MAHAAEDGGGGRRDGARVTCEALSLTHGFNVYSTISESLSKKRALFAASS